MSGNVPGLFEDEPDELDLFQDEADEASGEEPQLFQIERDETHQAASSWPVRAAPRAVSVGDVRRCFEEEADEPEQSDVSSESEYFADGEMETKPMQRRQVALSFKTINEFLATQIARPHTVPSTEPARKKRCYDKFTESRQGSSLEADKRLRRASFQASSDDAAPWCGVFFGCDSHREALVWVDALNV